MAIRQTPEFEQILREAHERKALSVHLVTDQPLCFRVNGEIESVEGTTLTSKIINSIAINAIGEKELNRIGKDTCTIKTSCKLDGVILGRMTIAKSLENYTISVHILFDCIHDIESCEVPSTMVKAAESPCGLVVIAGPIGSAKGAIAYSILDHINASMTRHICTAEDAIEAEFISKKSLIRQCEVGVDIPDLVSSIQVYHDADILLVNEVKTQEEIWHAVNLANRGYLVIAVMHGWSPEKIIQQMITNQPIETQMEFRNMIARTLLCVSVQCLLRTPSGKGRQVAYGVLIPDEKFLDAIAEGADLTKSQTPLPADSHSLTAEIERLRDEGLVDPDHAESILQRLLKENHGRVINHSGIRH